MSGDEERSTSLETCTSWEIFGIGISFESFQKLAGALHVKGSLSNKEKAEIVIRGKSYGPPPAYGEVMYQYKMSKAGWNAANEKK